MNGLLVTERKWIQIHGLSKEFKSVLYTIGDGWYNPDEHIYDRAHVFNKVEGGVWIISTVKIDIFSHPRLGRRIHSTDVKLKRTHLTIFLEYFQTRGITI